MPRKASPTISPGLASQKLPPLPVIFNQDCYCEVLQAQALLLQTWSMDGQAHLYFGQLQYPIIQGDQAAQKARVKEMAAEGGIHAETVAHLVVPIGHLRNMAKMITDMLAEYDQREREERESDHATSDVS